MLCVVHWLRNNLYYTKASVISNEGRVALLGPYINTYLGNTYRAEDGGVLWFISLPNLPCLDRFTKEKWAFITCQGCYQRSTSDRKATGIRVTKEKTLSPED